jgi:hypothetical protein
MTKRKLKIDLNDPEQARLYCRNARFGEPGKSGPITYVDMSGGRRIYLDKMTDDEAVEVASALYEQFQTVQDRVDQERANPH